MRPALGVTEPGAIALAVSTAREHIDGDIRHIELRLNSGMYKNAFTCGIPGTDALGNSYAAALGAVAADPKKGLECLDGITAEQYRAAKHLVDEGKITVRMQEIGSDIRIEAVVATDRGTAGAVIQGSHTNFVQITKNDQVVWQKKPETKTARSDEALIHCYSLEELYEYARTVPLEELLFIRQAFSMNYALFLAGMESEKTRFLPYLLWQNGGAILSDDEQKTASLLCNGAIEARVLGLARPAMSITGSGAHGIIAVMPLYAAYKVRGYTEEALLRATALSYLVCMYIKEYSGKLSAFCGCAIAAGTGMACGLAMLRGGDAAVMDRVIRNMAGSITGMICDGGNQGCTMKGVVAVDAAWQSAGMAMAGTAIDSIHGIAGDSPEETMRNMGRIASPGMVETEKTILDILEEKRQKEERRE